MLKHHFPVIKVFNQKESYLKVNVFSNFQKGCKQSYNTYIVNGFTFQSDMPDNLIHIKDPFHSSDSGTALRKSTTSP